MAGKKTGKRLLTWVLVLVMALSLLPLNALAASNSTVELHPSVGSTVTGVKVKVGDIISGYRVSSISGYNITVDLGTYNVNNKTFRLPYAKDIWKGVDNNKVDYISWAGSGSNRRSEGASALLANGKNTAYYYFKGAPVLLTFTLNYDANGGTGAPASQTYKATSEYEKSHTFTISSQAPTRDGYTFAGWADSANATEAKYQPGGTIDVQHKDSPKIVYAVWEKNDSPMPDIPAPSYDDLKSAIGKIQVTDVSTPSCETKNYDLIDNTSNDPFNWTKTARLDQSGKYDVTIKTAPYVAKYNSEIAKAHELNDASQTTLKLVISYKNSKWVLDDSKTEIKVKHTESTPAETPPEAPTADKLEKLEMAVQVKCVVDDSQQHTEAYGLLGEYNEDYFVGAPKKDGDDWLCEISYDPDLYVAKFNTAFPNLKHVRNDEKIVPVTLIWADGSWQLKTQGSVHVTEEYTVTFNAYGGFPMPDEQHVKSGEKAVLPAEPTLKGHTFAFWYLGDDEENATAYDFDTPVTGDITLTAKWNINKYTVTFNSYGGTPVPPAQEVEYGLTATKPDDPTLKGHTFAFWYLGEDEENATAYDFDTPVTGDITLTAKWNINKYTVTFNSYGGTPVPPAQEVEYGLTATEPATAPTKTGYTFDGWYLGDEKYDFSDAVEQNITLYANWEKNIYTVTYTDGVDGEEVFADQTYRVPFEDTTPAFKGNPTRDGYVFDGWKPAFSDTVTGNVTYVAQWTARTDLSYTVHYYLKGTTKKVADDKTVDGQTFNAVVKEEAIRISGYRVYGNSVKSITIGTGTNEIIFYYTRASRPSTPSKPTLNTGDHYAYVMGYPDGTVRPNGSITRAEVSTILFRLLSDKTRDEYFTTESSFTDVKAGAWYNNSIATLEKAGVIVDTAKGGAFRPNEAITRAELAAMLAQFSDAKPVKGVKFSDVSAEHWAYEAIAIAAKMGWIEGYPDGTFRPDATITRAEMMTLVNRALERVPSDEDHLLSKRVMLTFPDCKSGDWFYIAVQEATNSHTYERAATEKNGDEQWTALRANRDWTQLEK